ncbi:hypothetical protein QJS04_geneDACA008375 [Acorus gramineus]|uniref:Uncharacterized protein n=1 Tax=Acorus gramineus TaxID=55184 RepID=A0AAV9AII0_ACOGR|nr:hypothetical protein QJS04_geneDACA008375 [Acorus gramineus]
MDGSDRPGSSSAVTATGSSPSSSDFSASVPSQPAAVSLSPPPLPSSSGAVAVPEESVSHLFSVYTFLRSFGHHLYLSPFTLDDFVGSLNCSLPNNLSDAVHLSLLRAVRRHLEAASSDPSADGHRPALRCLSHSDWSLLDNLTWPTFLIEYLFFMGHLSGLGWKGFCDGACDGEYYVLPVNAKLRVLQMLCDDASDTAEIRAEIAAREIGVEDAESEGAIVPPPPSTGTGLRKAHLGKAKPNVGVVVEEENDENGDECRLCGMDGTLVCCDGCPSVYHSRCIGLNKALLPEGPWYCPECMVDRMGGAACSMMGMGLRGAVVFGIDPFGRVFLGTCNYLLVINTFVNAKPMSRYYNRNDVVKVLEVLCSSRKTNALYAYICRGILQYWDISDFSLPDITESATSRLVKKESDAVLHSSEQTHNVSRNVDGENDMNMIVESTADRKAVSAEEVGFLGTGVNGAVSDGSEVGAASKPAILLKDGQRSCAEDVAISLHLVQGISTKSHEHPGNGPAISGGSLGLTSNISDSTTQRSSERSVVIDNGPCVPQNKFFINLEDSCSRIGSVRDLHERRQGNQSCGGQSKHTRNGESLMGSSFKPNAYINLYIMGEVAASAAANLAVLASEDSRISEVHHVSANKKKLVSELQIKAFSRDAMPFFWPSPEKKLMEVPRERCGWCISCKGLNTSKRGCLLNYAAFAALKGAAKVLGGLRSVKYVSSHLTEIALYILLMEESLRGLFCGPMLDARYREWWRGRRGIPGVSYAEGFEVPRRSRRAAWRAAVEMTRNSAQLALQVRYLDAHLRWGDLVSPNQNAPDGKGSDVEASAFRNAVVCDKKTVDTKTRYALDFGSQKHLPLRVMKNVIETEKTQEQEKLWFSENCVPLYLIKEYDVKAEKIIPDLPDLCIRQPKARRRDILVYLFHKGDKPNKCSCCSCQKDILLRKIDIDQERKQHSSGTETRVNRVKSRCNGLIWKKKNSKSNETGIDFRINNVILRGNADMGLTNKPICALCSKPYSSDLIYIRCEFCKYWYHADALDLREDQILNLVGFKCCKCRRMASPICPYVNLEKKPPRKQLKQNIVRTNESINVQIESGFKSKRPRFSEDNTPSLNVKAEDVTEDDALLFSLSAVVPITEDPHGISPKWERPEAFSENLQNSSVVRPHVMTGKDVVFSETQNVNPLIGGFPQNTPVERFDVQHGSQVEEDPTAVGRTPVAAAEWEITETHNQLPAQEGEIARDMDFEPQTFFSFAELLSCEGDHLDSLFDLPMNATENWCDELSGFGGAELVCDSVAPTILSEPHGNVGAMNHSLHGGPVKYSCQFCKQDQPSADLLCEICGLRIHNHCSRWVEMNSDNSPWRCGNCRDWR